MPPGERPTQALGHAKPSARLKRLAAEHERLRKQVQRRRRELERLEADIRESGTEMATRAVPFIEETLRLDAAIHTAFADILARKRLSRDAREQIRGIYTILMQHGTISPPEYAKKYARQDGSGEGADRGARPAGDAGAQDGAESGAAGQDADESHRGRAAHLRDLRKTFLALADAMHPDKVQCEEEKHARTEAMKELNQAYRDGDVARLLEIERAWNLQGKLEAGDEDEIERRCQAIERQNALLVDQFRALGKTLRLLRRSESGTMVAEVRQLRRQRDPDPIGALLEPVEAELETLRAMASFVQSFLDGEISLDDFLAGPTLPGYFEEDEEEPDFDALLELMEKAVAQATRKAKAKKKKKPRKR
jgi:hypothetical protein